jgi:hypothetical protein
MNYGHYDTCHSYLENMAVPRCDKIVPRPLGIISRCLGASMPAGADGAARWQVEEKLEAVREEMADGTFRIRYVQKAEVGVDGQ